MKNLASCVSSYLAKVSTMTTCSRGIILRIGIHPSKKNPDPLYRDEGVLVLMVKAVDFFRGNLTPSFENGEKLYEVFGRSTQEGCTFLAGVTDPEINRPIKVIYYTLVLNLRKNAPQLML